jgi:tRNA(Arg) A34 adenosine deaminase TadA
MTEALRVPHAGLAQLVAHHSCKVGVTGSSPVAGPTNMGDEPSIDSGRNGAMTDETLLSATDETHLARAIGLARRSRANGNHPFGAVLVAVDGTVLEGLNTVVTDRDPTGHAETNLVRLAGATLTVESLRSSTLYTSTEPCAMCSGAIYWAGIARVVYALPESALREMVPEQDGEPTLDLPCRDVFVRGGRTVTVAGPALTDDAAAVHAGFWGATS